MGVVENSLLFNGRFPLLFVPDGIGVGLEIDGASCVLSLIHICVGMDNVDQEAARRLGIRTFNTPGANSDAVADYTFGMMLDLARSISVTDRDLKAGQVKKHLGYPVYGRTLGIIGLGAIGKGMARRALGFGMKVMAYDVFWDCLLYTSRCV